MEKPKKVLNGLCSYCQKKIESKFKSCYMCNKKRLADRPIIKNCTDCGIVKDTIYKYCVKCYPKHANDWKEKEKKINK